MAGAPGYLSETPDFLDLLIEALRFLPTSLTRNREQAQNRRNRAMDVLSDVLRVVRLSGAMFFTAECSSPWAIESPIPDLLTPALMPEADCLVLFHILTEGSCIVECKGLPAVKMSAGDVVIFPHAETHTMRSHVGVTPAPIGSVFPLGTSDGLQQVAFGGGGEKTTFICGYLNCDQRFSPLTAALPTMLLVRSGEDYAVEAIDRN